MSIKLADYFNILLLAFAAVSLLPAPKWARLTVGALCGVAAVLLIVRNLTASA